MLTHTYTHARIVTKSSCTIYIKGMIRIGNKAQITEGRMCLVARRVCKRNLQLAWQGVLVYDGQQVCADTRRIGKDIESLLRIHTAQWGTHDITREITAAPTADNAVIQSI